MALLHKMLAVAEEEHISQARADEYYHMVMLSLLWLGPDLAKAYTSGININADIP